MKTMKKKQFTKKQITEAIKHWTAVLENMESEGTKFEVGDIVKFNKGETFEGRPIDDTQFLITSKDVDDGCYMCDELDDKGNVKRNGGSFEIWFGDNGGDLEYPCEVRMQKVK